MFVRDAPLHSKHLPPASETMFLSVCLFLVLQPPRLVLRIAFSNNYLLVVREKESGVINEK